MRRGAVASECETRGAHLPSRWTGFVVNHSTETEVRAARKNIIGAKKKSPADAFFNKALRPLIGMKSLLYWSERETIASSSRDVA